MAIFLYMLPIVFSVYYQVLANNFKLYVILQKRQIYYTFYAFKSIARYFLFFIILQIDTNKLFLLLAQYNNHKYNNAGRNRKFN